MLCIGAVYCIAFYFSNPFIYIPFLLEFSLFEFYSLTVFFEIQSKSDFVIKKNFIIFGFHNLDKKKQVRIQYVYQYCYSVKYVKKKETQIFGFFFLMIFSLWHTSATCL